MVNQLTRLDSIHVEESANQQPLGRKFKMRFNLSPERKKFFVTFSGVLFFLLVLGLIVSIMQKYIQVEDENISPQASATPISQGKNYIPSPYAGDEKVLEIEDRVLQLESELELIDFREETLRPPSLDWNVEFDD